MIDEIREKIAQELERLAHELNVAIPQAIQHAVENGDLRESADYNSALERQRFVQARIQHLSHRMAELSRLTLTELPRDRVGFGSRVTVLDLDSGEEATYTMVSGDDIDFDAGHISIASPIGRALLDREVGEEVMVQLPRAECRLRVLGLTTLPQMVGSDGKKKA
ncbi:MAG: GreA/GreB family elongation factor [Gemmatimonadetes bacterium]|nr:GreA/GreB family elongation factor [Gemmatimonadota bacterium]